MLLLNNEKHSLLTTPMELIKRKRGGCAWGEPSARSTNRRVPEISGSMDEMEILKSTCQAERYQLGRKKCESNRITHHCALYM